MASSRLLAVVSCLAGLGAIAPSAHAAVGTGPTGSIDITAPSTTITIPGNSFTYTINYSLSGTGITTSKFVVVLPKGMVYQSTTAPSGVGASCGGDLAVGQQCTFTIGALSGGVAGQATVTGFMAQFYNHDGDPANAVATLTATYDLGDGVGPQQMTPVADTQPGTISAGVSPSISIEVRNASFTVNPSPPPGKSATGLEYDYHITSTNNGGAQVEANWTLTNTAAFAAASPLRFVSFSSTAPTVYTTTSAPSAYGTGNLVIKSSTPMQSFPVGDYTVRVWISCTDLPKVTGDITFALALAGSEIKASGTVAVTGTPSTTVVPTAAGGACGTGGGSVKSSSPELSVGEGDNFSFTVATTPPNGVVQATNVVIVDRLPAKVKLVSASAPTPSEFTLYYCVVPAESGNFTAAQFINTYKNANCSTTANTTTVTHLVWFAPTWGSPTGITSFAGSYVMNPPFDAFTDNEVVTNTANAAGSYTFSGAQTFSFPMTDTIKIRTLGQTSVFVFAEGAGQPKVPGQKFFLTPSATSTPGLARVKNPIQTLFLPNGINYVMSTAPRSNSCGWSPFPTVFSAQPTVTNVTSPIAGKLYTWTYGDASNPVRLPLSCGGQGSQPYNVQIDVQVQLDPNRQFVNGEQFVVPTESWGENAPTHASHFQFVTLAVPGEMRTDVQPDCTTAQEPSLLVTYTNSGGTVLTNASVTVKIPKLADGSGTQADTNFLRVENLPAGTTLSYAVAATPTTFSTTAPANLTTVVAVRVSENAAVPAYTPQKKFNVVLSVPGNTPTGTFIRGSSTMKSDELGLLASANSAPIKVNLCPGTLGVHVFFDSDGDGVKDAGESNLPNYSIKVTDPADTTLDLTWKTDTNGAYSSKLAPATYHLVLTVPGAANGATYTPVTIPDQAVTSGSTKIVEIPIRCTCNDNNSCTADTCEIGVCSFQTTRTPAASDPTCDGIDDDCDNQTDENYAPVAASCGEGLCKVTGASACVAGVVKFKVGSTVTDACTPNASASTAETCDSVDNDCDGLTDDGIGKGDTCTNGLGECTRTGTKVCGSGGAVVCNAAVVTGTTETCDSKDNDCDGLTDGADDSLQLQNCTKQSGVCAGSQTTRQLCVNGTWGACTDQIYAANAFPSSYVTAASNTDTCDGKDNDCDNATDENFASTNVSCGVGACAVTGATVCVSGATLVHIGNQNVAQCTPNAAASSAEVCDSIDNDCDGLTDAADTLSPGSIPSCELQGGVCKGSKKPKTLCVGGDWQACSAATYSAFAASYSPVDNTCNGVDNDCSGVSDGQGNDDDYVAPVTVCGVGRCAGTVGTLACQAGSTSDTCDPDANAVAETCNGQDDDCDGETDEGFGLGASCTVGQFACLSTGKVVCGGTSASGTVCDAPVINGVTEKCDGADNDCDGVADEDFDLGTDCTVGQGACLRTGKRACVGQTGAAACNAAIVTGTAELCNGIDDDCDGTTDEGACAALDTAINTHPPAITAASTATFTYVDTVTAGNTQFECRLDNGNWADCDNGTITYTDVTDGTHAFLVRAVGPTGNVDPTPAFYSWEVDTTVPDTTVLSGPQNPSQSPIGEFVFGSNVADPSAWFCAIDPLTGAPNEADWTPCDETWSFPSLPDGPHTVFVYVVNEIGIADPTPASYAWVIDTKAPGTSVVGPDVVCTDGASFTYTSDDPSVEDFTCSFDGAAWVGCDSGAFAVEDLKDGEHTFAVAAIDGNGNVDPTPATVTFTVDTKAPETTLDLAPLNPSQSGSATFVFSSNEASATFTCKVDAKDPAPCTSPLLLTGLGDGSHTVAVTADDGCKADLSPATHTWVVDTTFPETAYLTTPPFKTGKGATNTFTYQDPTDPTLTVFECKLDAAAAWSACDGGTLAAGVLPVGTHTLVVRSCDVLTEALRQCDPTPAVYTWEVTESPCPLDANAPTIVCAGTQTLECVAGQAALDTAALKPNATDACLPVSVSTTSPATYPLGLSPLVYEAVDGNGNRATCVTSVSVLDTKAPVITCPAAVELKTPNESCGVANTLAAATATDACYADVAVFSNAPPVFGLGTTVVTYTALDAAGNTTTCTTNVVVKDEVPLTVDCEKAVTKDAPAEICGWTGTLQATASDNCAVDALVVERTNTYKVGVQDVEFTAEDDSGNEGACTTVLTVNDITKPVLVCPAASSAVPATFKATATDACTATAVVKTVTCTEVDGGTRTPIAAADCPVTFEGDTVNVTGRPKNGMLEVVYGLEAKDPSGNTATQDCTVTFAADLDQDGVIDPDDDCPADPDTAQTDGDGDGVGDACDLCPAVADADQKDSDNDGTGDACQDTDDDGVIDTADNCPLDPNPAQEDFDKDGLGTPCDPSDSALIARGSGGCAGGGVGSLLALVGAAGALMLRRRRA